MTTAIKERPILFSSQMVRAILDGRKTQTRRIVKFPGTWAIEPHPYNLIPWPGALDECGDWECLPCRYGYEGDRLWVRESFDIVEDPAAHDPNDGPEPKAPPGYEYKCAPCVKRGPEGERLVVDYAATPPNRIMDVAGMRKWRPSIHMPRWASRLVLEITDVRVERVQDISEADAEAEGVDAIPDAPASLTHRSAFGKLWNKINGAGSWESNPWVWVLAFQRLHVLEQ